MSINDDKTLVDEHAQTFVICAITIALTAGPIGFELGAYSTIFVSHMFQSWFLVTASLLAMAILPRARLPFPKSRLIFLLLPSVWMLVRIMVPVDERGDVLYPLLFAIAGVSLVLCLPYCIYLLLRLMRPEFFDLPGKKPKYVLSMFLIAFLGVGYLLGKNSRQILSCEDFDYLGAPVPQDCVEKLP